MIAPWWSDVCTTPQCFFTLAEIAFVSMAPTLGTFFRCGFGKKRLTNTVSRWLLVLGSTSRLDGSSTSRDRSLWNLQQRTMGGGGGSAWARSTTTRDSPVLSGLTDGLSSLFSVVEHSGSTESLWRADGGANISSRFEIWRLRGVAFSSRPDVILTSGSSQGASPARQPPAAGKPSGEPSPQRYGLVQEFIRNVCSSRTQEGLPLPGERVQRDSLGGLGLAGGFGTGEAKPECVVAGVGGHGALVCLGGSNDNVTRIVNRRFMRQTAGEEMVSIMGGGKEMNSAGATGTWTEVGAPGIQVHFYKRHHL